MSELTNEQLGDEIQRLAAHIDAAVCEWLLAAGPRERTAGDRYQVIVHVDAAALAASDGGPQRCQLDDGPIARETARRLACDAGVVPMFERGGSALSVGRKTRAIPPAIRRALKARDGGCQFPGCTCTRWLDAHHIDHWAHGGPTALENLVQLCRRHHRLLHEGGWTVERARDGDLVFLTPHGARMRNIPTRARGDCNGLIDSQRRNGVAPGPDAPVPGWMGDSLDLGYAVDAILSFTDEPEAEAG